MIFIIEPDMIVGITKTRQIKVCLLGLKSNSALILEVKNLS